MGTALGFAMTQPALIALAIFASLGIGMALPFLLLAMFPSLLQRLPRPGAWMLTFRQFLAFPLYAAAVWLLWVLGNQTGVNGMALIAGGAILVAMGIWMWSLQASGRGLVLLRVCSLAARVIALALVRSPLLEPQARQSQAGAGWEVYSKERAGELRRAGQAHFVNVTADWCITCLANERFALSDPEVKEAFQRYELVYLKGDWTNNDPKLTELLQTSGRSGVPLYLLVAADGKTVILPQLLTPGVVLDTFEQHLPQVALAHAKM
jgi:thiol:disulfide interchange protein DsbD